MAQGSRPDRVGEAIRQELSAILAREVHDPGMGFVTLTRVTVSPDLQVARVFYTELGDAAAKLSGTVDELLRRTGRPTVSDSPGPSPSRSDLRPRRH